MVGVIFHYYDQLDDGLRGGYKYYFESLIYSIRLSNLGATHILCIDTSHYSVAERFKNFDDQVTFLTHPSLQAILDAYPNKNFIFLENQATVDNDPSFTSTDLKDFVHPANPIYVVGPDKGPYTPPVTDFVVINGVDDLIAETALAIALYDRLNKL